MDIALSLAGLILCAPVMVAAAAAVWLEDGGPVIYAQNRAGWAGIPFRIYKFRSMRKDAERLHQKMKEECGVEEVSFKPREDPRVTRTGRFIRKYNIDELPQLVNILKGEMSFVGPRPLPDYEAEEQRQRYGDRYLERYAVAPGLTCTWQVSNRTEVSFEERMQMDVDYARECSLGKDLVLIVKTFLYTITGKAAY